MKLHFYFIFLHVCVCGTCIHMWRAEEIVGCCSFTFYLIPLRHVLLLNLELALQPAWKARVPQYPSVSSSQSGVPGFGWSPSPHACIKLTLGPKPSLQLHKS